MVGGEGLSDILRCPEVDLIRFVRKCTHYVHIQMQIIFEPCHCLNNDEGLSHFESFESKHVPKKSLQFTSCMTLQKVVLTL